MILPIVAYGDPVLRKECKDISKAYPNLDALLENMYETMYGASGVGLAAPQIGLPIRIFLVDASPFADKDQMDAQELALVEGFKKTFINATILEEQGEEFAFKSRFSSISCAAIGSFLCFFTGKEGKTRAGASGFCSCAP